ncbi:MAG: energy-coupling factor ABC transporter permease [Chromatiales bacterium]|jgi:uncharacterized membrane protein
MYIESPQLLSDVNLLANAVYLVVLIQALRHADWARLARLTQLNIFLLGCAALVTLWSMRAGISPGLAMHYLGVTTLTLVFGWPLAVLGSALALGLVGWMNGMDFTAFGVNALVIGVLPVLVTELLRRVAERRLPANYFVYVFVCAFLAGILALLVSAAAVAGLMALSGSYPMAKIRYEYLAYLPLLALPEGVINGMVVTVMAALKPEWIASFDERRYLGPD